MRHFMSSFRSLFSTNGNASPRVCFKNASRLVAIVGLLAITPAFAQEPTKKPVKPVPTKKVVVAVEAHADAHAEAPVLPECLLKLKLDAPQQEQITAITQKYDQSIAQVWKQFGERYMQTIKLESSMLAAIEDNLTDEQREQVREERKNTAHSEKAHAKHGKHQGAAEKEIAAAGVTLTHEQEAAAGKVHQKYRDQLHSMNHEIHGLHARLISLEAHKLAEIEKVLTKDQLAQLRLDRQAAPAAAKAGAEDHADQPAKKPE
ncbi:MAG: hypothetical protein JWM11_1430 [Planctomycetaceae bacterium]|nr:hypothetical protein [Planctomycetaceae bacterium]